MKEKKKKKRKKWRAQLLHLQFQLQLQGHHQLIPKFSNPLNLSSEAQKSKGSGSGGSGKKPVAGKPTNGVGKRRMPPSLHELHYTANRAQAEEMRKKDLLALQARVAWLLGI
ncbi:hypothetical protein GBA52_018252 [Prunus armeniaca]|nr:hypothetical protein GBA52_018252 [Prunus armeniaca]